MISTLEALVVLVLSLAVVCWTRRCQKRLDMPCPVGIPVLGNLLQVDPKKPHFTFTDWSRKLGEIFCVRMCGLNLVVVNSFSAVHEVLAERGHDLAGRPRNFRARCFTNNFRNIGFCNPCPEWKMLRRAVHRDLKMFGNGLQRLEDITTGVVREMAAEVAALGQRSRAIDVRPLLYSATMNIMCVFLVGNRYRKTDEEFLLFQEMERLGVTLIASAGKGAELDAFPWLRWIGNETYARLVKFSQLRDDLYARLKQRTLMEMNIWEGGEGGGGKEGRGGVERNELAGGRGEGGERPEDAREGEVEEIQVGRGERERGAGKEENSAIIRTLLKMVDEFGGGNGFNEEFIKGTFADLILAGTASTTNLVYAYLNIMLHNRTSYERVKAEIAHCLRDVDLDPESVARRPCLSDKASMPYTQASVLELLRYVSIAPFTVPHQALVDTTIGGYKVPRGTEVLCNLWSILHDEGLWPDPWRFRPERFLTDDGASLVAPDHPNRRHLLAFGAGPRRCPGEIFALSRLFLIVSSLLRDFDLHPDPEAAPVSCDPRTYSLGIALYPPDFRLRLTPTRFYAMQTV